MGEAIRRYQAREGLVRATITDSDYPNRVVVRTTSDLEPVLDSIARDRAVDQRGALNKRVARLPAFIVEDLIHRGIYDDPGLFRRWLNSAEAAPWRIWQGRL